MVAAKSSRVNRQYKKKYRIRNWREYERGLRSRGDVTIWLSEDAIAAWVPPKNGLRGGQRRYSNLAVRTALTLRVVFSLPLRQTEGFLDSLLRLMGLNLKAPDHTTLSRRNQIVAVPPLTRSYDGPIDLIVDSTGLQILGCGEWNAHKHKASKKRRDWRKLHIGVDAEGTVKLSRIRPFCGRILLDQRLRINDLAVAAGGENAAKLLNLTVSLDDPETSAQGLGEVLGSRCTHLEIKLCSVAPKWVYIFQSPEGQKENSG